MKHKHPKALTYLTICYSLYMIGFISIVSSLVLYQTTILKIDDVTAYAIFAATIALLWILPLGGGYLSTKFGYNNGARMGLIFCTLGLAVLCIPQVEAFYVGLAFFVVGNAFGTPAIWCMVDHCYSKESEMREAGFTLFYLYFNIGALVGIFVGGYLSTTWGFAYEWAFGAVTMAIALVFLHWAKHKIHVHEGRSIAAELKWPKGQIWGALALICVISTPIVAILFNYPNLNNVLMLILLGVMVGILGKVAFDQKDARARGKMIVFIILSLISIAFWTLYSLEPSFLTVFIEHNAHTRFLGINIPASSYFAFDGIFVIIFGFFLSRVWVYLSERGRNPSLSSKFAASLIIIGLGVVFLSLVLKIIGPTLMPSWCIVVAYAFFAFAELLVSPIGISMVGSLAPEGQEGVMMGFWQLASGISGIVAGYIGVFVHLPTKGEALALSNPVYMETFFYVGLGAIVAGLIILPFIGKLRRLMAEHPYHDPQL